jgi:drug/metabolite transporter (DMT)-like permease
VALLGLTGVFAYNALFFKGLQLISAGRASLVIATSPVLIALFSAWLYGEKLSPVKIAGILLSVTGAIVVISKGSLAAIFKSGPGPASFISDCSVPSSVLSGIMRAFGRSVRFEPGCLSILSLSVLSSWPF